MSQAKLRAPFDARKPYGRATHQTVFLWGGCAGWPGQLAPRVLRVQHLDKHPARRGTRQLKLDEALIFSLKKAKENTWMVTWVRAVGAKPKHDLLMCKVIRYEMIKL